MLRKLAIALAFVFALLPLWSVKYPPIQDLPVHMAAVRVIHSIHDMGFGFDLDYELTIGRTQYLLYYLGGSALAYVLDVRWASFAVVSFYLGGTVLATRSLLVALNKDERACLFVLPLLYNCSLEIGFLPFLIAVPLLLWSLAAAVRYLGGRPTREQGIVVAVLAMLLFTSHVLPFLFFGLGYALLWLVASRRLVTLLPLVPVTAFFAYWLFGTEAGAVTLRVITAKETGDPPWPFNQVFSDTYKLAFDTFRDVSDETVMLAFVALIVATIGLAQGDRDRARPMGRVLLVLPVAALFLFLRSGHKVGYVAHIKDRFPILFVFTAVPALARMPSGWRGWAVTAAALALGGWASIGVRDHYREFQRDEVGEFETALDAIPPRRTVAYLPFTHGSSIVTENVFLHYGSYYQVDKGGVVQFSFAGYPHWPVGFKPGRMVPPSGAPEGWAWAPGGVDPTTELKPYFDYVLARGHGFAPPQGTYHRVYEDSHWEVWKRD